ncbi:MAG: SIMPL domain-containing protein [Spirochaetaceae bacterium]|nr:SIMPL domain-containing protein [Spirochaetaceae bacterium]
MIRTARNPLIPASPRAPENGSAYGLCAVVVVLMATLATAGCGTTPQVQDVGAPGAANAQPGTVVVRAEGSVPAVPDIAVLGIGVEITQPSVAEARDRAARVTEAVVAELRRLGVEDRDMQTSRFSIQPDYQYTDDGRRRLAGYRVVHTLTVTYRDLETVGAAIDAVSEAGGDELAFRDIAFAHSDPERNLEAARRKAVDRLHRTARQLAEAANRELGPLLEISEGVAPPESPYPRPAMGALLKAEAVDTPISIGSDTITVTVRGVFALH